MRWWRLHPGRSTRWQAEKWLRKNRTVRGWPWMRLRLSSWVRRAGWLTATTAALLLSAPLAWYVGHRQADWLGGAWQVSAVLVGLVVALIVFLLQAAAAQSLRAEGTYRALLAHTFLIWPLALTLVFLAWVAAIGRYEGTEPAPAFAETWALVLFMGQLAGFGLVFARLLQLVSPQGVARVIEGAFADSVRRSVEQKLLRKVGRHLLNERAQEAQVRFGDRIFARGHTVLPSRAGWVRDVDLELPAQVVYWGFGADVHIVLELERRIDESAPIAYLTGTATRLREDVVRAAVTVRRRQRAAADPVEVFNEALDIARRALGDEARSSLDVAVDLLVACVEQLPRSYALFGAEYTAEVVSEGIFPTSSEDAVLSELRDFAREALLTERGEAAQRMPQLGYRLALAGIRERAPLLLLQALRLWLSQVYVAQGMKDTTLRGRVTDMVSEAAKYVVSAEIRDLDDDNVDMSKRLEAVDYLKEMFWFETQLLKMHADRRDFGAFEAAWRRSVEWDHHWSPGRAVDGLEVQLLMAHGVDEQRAVNERLDQAKRLVAARGELARTRKWNNFQLGAWLMWRYREGQLQADAWAKLYPYVLDTFSSVGELSEMLPQLWEENLGQLDSWEMGTRDLSQPTAYYSDVRDVGRFWATLLLLRTTSPTETPEFKLAQSADFIGKGLLSDIAKVKEDAAKWKTFLGEDVAGRTDRLKEAVEKAIDEDKVTARERVAAARVDDEKRRSFAAAQLQSYARATRLRPLLARAGAVEVEVTDAAFERDTIGLLVDKRPFITLDAEAVVRDWDQNGELAARRHDETVFQAVADLAPALPPSNDAVAAAADAVGTLREAGLEPDAVLAPNGIATRKLLWGHPRFAPTTPGLMESPPELGYLDDVPVFDVGPRDAGKLVVADVGKAVRVHERRLPSMSSGLRTDVRDIDEARANELLDSGAVNWDPEKQTREEAVRFLRDYTVEVFVGFDMRVEPGPTEGGAALSIPLAPDTVESDEPA